MMGTRKSNKNGGVRCSFCHYEAIKLQILVFMKNDEFWQRCWENESLKFNYMNYVDISWHLRVKPVKLQENFRVERLFREIGHILPPMVFF